MKPFDIEKAKAGEAVCTRDGRDVRILCYDMKNETHSIVGLVMTDSREHQESFTLRGEYESHDPAGHLDLFMKDKEVTEWLFIIENNEGERFPVTTRDKDNFVAHTGKVIHEQQITYTI